MAEEKEASFTVALADVGAKLVRKSGPNQEGFPVGNPNCSAGKEIKE